VTPSAAYEADIKHRGFTEDEAQRKAVLLTQNLYDDLLKPQKPEKVTSNNSFLGFFNFRAKKQPTTPINGLYFWGGVGRGKSYLIDRFYDCLPFPEKKRVHFNQFMQDIHNQLKYLAKTPDPLITVSEKIAKECRVLCIDEFYVDDITDAMIMAGLLDSLFTNCVTLVATSNIEPKRLYQNGLQRDRFLPAIDLILEHTTVYNLDSGIDYRLKLLEKHGTFHIQNDHSEAILTKHLNELATTTVIENRPFKLNNRIIQCRARTDNIIWFDFSEICETPRSSIDYIVLAKEFETILISNIPQFDDGANDVVQRFIQLVDALYDHHVTLITTAAAAPDQLYSGKGLQLPFQRTASRLYEMRSENYLSQFHTS